MNLNLPSFDFAEWVLIAIGIAGLIVTYARRDDRREGRRRAAIKGAAQLHAIGDRRMADVLECYAVGDKSGLARSIRRLVKKLREPGGAMEWRAGIVIATLPALKNHPVYGPKIAEAMAEGSPPTRTATVVPNATSVTGDPFTR